MLPFGYVIGYLKAYVNQIKDQNLDMPKGKRNHLSTNRNLADDYLFHVPRDPFISPAYATDEMLKQFPPMKIVVSSPLAMCCCFVFNKHSPHLCLTKTFYSNIM